MEISFGKNYEKEQQMKKQYKDGILLFWFFFKIGWFTFGGGWSILAQMEQEFVDKRQWITKQELLDLVAVGKSVPGIMITNISMLFGYSRAGWFGGICAVLGMTCPAVIILTVVTFAYDTLKDSAICYSVLRGIRSAVVPIMGSVVLSLGKDALRNKTSIIVCSVASLICIFTNVSNIVLVCVGAVAALIWHAMTRARKGGLAK